MITIRHLVALICEKMAVSFDQLCEVADDRLGKDSAYLLDSSKVRKDLNWRDDISLEVGIERTVDWVKANFDQLSNTPLDYIHKP